MGGKCYIPHWNFGGSLPASILSGSAQDTGPDPEYRPCHAGTWWGRTHSGRYRLIHQVPDSTKYVSSESCVLPTFSVHGENIGERAMTDLALANAQKRRDDVAAKINQLVQELEDARKELVVAESFIKEWYRFAGSEAGAVSDTKKDSGYPQPATAGYTLDLSEPPLALRQKNPDRATVGKYAREIINEFKRPVPRRVLFDALASRGIQIHGKDPEMVLSTMMWRMPQDFVRLSGHGYWFRNAPWPIAGYEPGTQIELDGEDADVIQNSLLDPASVSDA